TALGWPVIVKPSKMGSSVGMSLVRNAEGLDAAVTLARTYDAEVMAEQFVPGRELTVAVLGDVPLPVGEIIPKHELFDYECKYTPGMSEEIFPAKLDTTLARQLQELALTAHRALKLLQLTRQRSEEHTSELQSPDHLVCRLLLEKKKGTQIRTD